MSLDERRKSGQTSSELSERRRGRCQTCFETAIKKFAYQMLNILRGTQWKYKSEMPSLPSNVITKIPTFFMTFWNTMVQFWLVCSNVGIADILFLVREIPMQLWNSFIVYFCYWHIFMSCRVSCTVWGLFGAYVVLPGRLDLFPHFLVTACNQPKSFVFAGLI